MKKIFQIKFGNKYIYSKHRIDINNLLSNIKFKFNLKIEIIPVSKFYWKPVNFFFIQHNKQISRALVIK